MPFNYERSEKGFEEGDVIFGGSDLVTDLVLSADGGAFHKVFEGERIGWVDGLDFASCSVLFQHLDMFLNFLVVVERSD